MRARSLLCLIALFSCSLAYCSDSAGVHRKLDQKEKQLEQLWAEYWRTQYAIDSGEQKEASVQPVRAKINAVLLDSEFLRDLRSAHFTDPILRRRRELFLSDAVDARITGDPDLLKLVESITKDESEMRYDVDGKKLTRAEVNNILGREPRREQREKAWKAQREITEVTGKRIQQAMKLRLALARKYTPETFTDFMLRRKGLERTKLLEWFEQIRKDTESEYDQLLRRIKAELRVSKVEPWDLEYFGSNPGGSEKAFASAKAWEQTQAIASDLGYDFRTLPVTVKITDITFGGGTYPILFRKEVRILVNKYEGLRFTDTLLHESGHGLHYGFCNEPSFLLCADNPEPFDEGLGQVMALMLYRDDILTGRFGLSPAAGREVQEAYRMKSLFDLRSTMADSAFEFAAYENPDQDLTKLYAATQSKYLGIEVEDGGNWAYDPFYSSGPIYLQSYVVAEMVGRQIHAATTRRFGSKWDAKAGQYLQSKFFSRGGLHSVDEIMRLGTGKPLTPRYLIEALRPTIH
jgi:oligoendopeptidase F